MRSSCEPLAVVAPPKSCGSSQPSCFRLEEDSKHQPFPDSGSGPLSSQMNLTLLKLKRAIGPEADGEVYAYVVETVKPQKGSRSVLQEGSGPNFQGGRITLCTCKHSMRAGSHPSKWRGRWIAGFSSKGNGQPQRLFYLMRIERTFESHNEMWNALEAEVTKAKSMHTNRLGDVCQPRPNIPPGAEFDPVNYFLPRKDHVHIFKNGWHKDLNKDYQKDRKHRAALLLGAANASFLWALPSLALRGVGDDYRTRTKGCFKTKSLSDFLDQLVEIR